MKIYSRYASAYNGIVSEMFHLIRKQKRRRRQKDFATEASAKELR